MVHSYNKQAIRGDLSKYTRYSISELAETLGIPESTVHYNLKNMGMVNHYDFWVPHILTEKHLLTRVNECVSLLARHKELSFLNRIVTGDEEYIFYNNMLRKKSWPLPSESCQTVEKAGLHQKRSCCAFCGIVGDLSITNSYR